MEANDGKGAPVRIGRGEAVWELREVEARLKVGVIGVERFYGGGSAAGWSSPGFGVARRRRSEAWEREGSKRERGIAFWGFCRARALARRVRRALLEAVHGDGEVEAAWAALEAAGRVARPGRLQREATGGGGGAVRRVGDSARRSNGRDGREASPRRRRATLSVDGGEKQSREGEMVIRAIL